ncbi:hypothetical protein, partial [Escherichia coli]|uniref:hypothetical protein n=1 Tax=Escherichia coli TaxID=562 RepID=UPI001BB476CC
CFDVVFQNWLHCARITRNTTPNKATCLPPLNSGDLPSSPARSDRLVFRAPCKVASASAVTGLKG